MGSFLEGYLASYEDLANTSKSKNETEQARPCLVAEDGCVIKG